MRKRLRAPFDEHFEVCSWQSIKDLSQYSLTEQEVRERVYFIHESGRAIGAAAGLSEVGLHMKQPWRLIALIVRLPVLSNLVELIYRLVARNRHRLPGGSDECTINNR